MAIRSARTVTGGRGWRLVVGVLLLWPGLLAALPGLPVGAAPADRSWAPPAKVFIPATGHTIDRLFLDLWREGGGVWAFGNPITREIEQRDRRVVQYFEYARFEYRPEGDGQGSLVGIGNVGTELAPPMLPRRFGASASRTQAMMGREARAWLPMGAAAVERAGEQEASYRVVAETGHGVWGGFRAFWEATGEAAYLGNPLTEEYAAGGISFQVFERGKLRWRPGEDVRLVPVGELLVERYGLPTKREQRGKTPVYDEALFVPPVAQPAVAAAPPPPIGAGRSVVVSLGQQALWAYEGRQVVLSTYVSTGTERFATPPGLFFVNTKIDSQTMEGVIGGEYYNVPGVPYVMYFTDLGHALHGTYWHQNFGTPMSHGCVNLPMDVAEWMYTWAPLGMPVLVLD